MDERYEKGQTLKELGWIWRDIARELDPDFAKDPNASTERMRIGVRRMMRSKK
jgi:hypothetical protein